MRFMLGRTEISDNNLTGQRCPCTHHPAFFRRISWPNRVQTVWPKWLFQPWPQLWIGPSSLTGPSVRSEHCPTIWTGPQTSGRIRSWSLSPSRKVSTKITMMSGPLLLLRPSNRESPWNRFYQPVTGNCMIPSHSFI